MQRLQSQDSSTEAQHSLVDADMTRSDARSDKQKVLIRELQSQVAFLYEKVRQLSNELQTTRQSHQLSTDQSRAEITMLKCQLQRQKIRHEEVVSLLRKRLVEGEMAKNRIQDQMFLFVEEDTKKEQEMAQRLKEVALKVNEDTKWVSEQMSYWKESMEEHEKRMDAAKMRGELDAEFLSGAMGEQSDIGQSEIRIEETATQRRILGRSLLGLDEDFDSDD